MKLTVGRIQRSLQRSPESFDGKQSIALGGLTDCRWYCRKDCFARSVEIREFIGDTVEII